eukprot:g26911.t1
MSGDGLEHEMEKLKSFILGQFEEQRGLLRDLTCQVQRSTRHTPGWTASIPEHELIDGTYSQASVSSEKGVQLPRISFVDASQSPETQNEDANEIGAMAVMEASRARGTMGMKAHGVLFIAILPIYLGCQEEADCQVTELLQRSLEVETPHLRRLKASPMFWLHIPKCGTSFYNTVTHLPGMCPDLPVNLSMGDESVWGKCFETHFRALCPTLCDQKLLHCDWPPTATHQFLVDSKYEEYKGHFVGLFRQPEQRLLSAYHDDKDLFRSDPFIPACSNETMTKELSMEAFIQRYASFETGQLVGTLINLTLADASLYDTSILNGWVDELDRPVYAKAKEIFERDLQKFGISHETCKSCYDEAGLVNLEPQFTCKAFAKRLVSSHMFVYAVTSVIVFNLVVLGIEVEASTHLGISDIPTWFGLCNGIVVGLFTLELSVNLYAQGFSSFFCGRERWWPLGIILGGRGWRNLFDLLIIVLSLLETVLDLWAAAEAANSGNQALSPSQLRFARSIRLARALRGIRVMRLLRYVSALRTLVLSIMSSMASLMWTLVLLLLLFYSFGVLFTQMVTDAWRFAAGFQCVRYGMSQ